MLCIGGDQKTASRIKGCQRIRSNAERGKDQLKGFVPVIEDWHAKMCLLEVSYVLYYNNYDTTECKKGGI